MKNKKDKEKSGLIVLWALMPFVRAKLDALADRSLPETGDELKLYSNYPNPFRTITIIYFALMHASKVQIDIMDNAGKKIVTLTDEMLEAGIQRVPLYRVMNDLTLSSGEYQYQITVTNGNGRFKQRRSLTLL